MVSNTVPNEELIHEYPAVNRYRIRVLRKRKKVTSIDVREYVDAEKFKGYTRKGVRLTDKHDIETLRDSLTDALARGWFD